MSRFSKTWWGQRFLEALEAFTDRGRLQRGRSYAGDNRILAFDLRAGEVTALVRGNRNPYFGVYTEPTYITTLAMQTLPATRWKEVIAYLGARAGFVSRLLMHEMPDDIEDAFARLDLHLLPSRRDDFETHCSCPDWENPCKHVAGVYYRLAGLLDRDPLLLFELRGLPRDKLTKELARTPLGKVLAAALAGEEATPEPAESYFSRPRPVAVPDDLTIDAFWHGQTRLPARSEPITPPSVPAILIKQAGDYPAFWERDNSFMEAMEDLYQRVRKVKDAL
jgi:uncharacterized Zn finger protein